ncbi:probable cellulose 1,4-beta-cellobiosidase [Cephalotrichum gorgonifer]|uniref:Glucanase n=1 Tax=Cephalotrichum gorgonifer TaxID=2041049 RepID=A0AAE8N0T7_9PEZI|nr:probable cellulose 1,4-beta-cellobiosidase [Cephalotrichum gorgonifer]
MFKKLSALALILGAVNAQQACSLTAETQPSVSWSKCSENGNCSKVAGSIVLDSNWRWTHTVQGSTNCYTGNEWDESICTDGETCASKCCLDGADYSTTYGINANADTVSLQYVTKHQYGTNIGSRVYLMEDENNYQMFNLLGNEFTFDVDVSNIGCGLNGALYFVPMAKDGGKSAYSSNKAGAKYGTGYCDAQCPRDMKWIAGRANVEGWNAVEGDANSGVGNMGTCCAEMDVWEANKISTAFTPHPCTTNEPHTCTGNSCGGTYSNDRYGGTCDPDGCDFNAWRQGDETFYGPGATVDTNKKMTVVTQWHTNAAGDLTDIKRIYVQDGVVIENAESLIPGVAGNLINEEYCTVQKAAFGDPDIYEARGGHSKMSDALKIPQVLVMSLWDDGYANMRWLDSNYPETSTKPGASRGSCSTTGGVPDDLRESVPNSKVVFSNIKFGPIGSTYDSDGGSNPPTSSSSAAPPASTSTSAPPPTGTGSPQWGQCGGIGWNGPKTCVSPFKCTVVNDYYSQCL